jgi:hypothetical protein
MYISTGSRIRHDLNTYVAEGGDNKDLFIADKIFPVYMVEARQGTYPKFILADSQRMNNDIAVREPRSSAQEVIRKFTSDTYDCLEYRLRELVDDSERADNARFFNQEVLAAQFTGEQLRLGLEVRTAAAVQNTSNFTSTNASVAYTETNIATINFVKDLQGAIARGVLLGEKYDTVVMSNILLDQIGRSTLFQNFVRGNITSTTNTVLAMDQIRASLKMLGIDNLQVGYAAKNNNKKGQSYSGTQVWSNAYIWVGKVRGGDPYAGGAGRILAWSEFGSLWNTKSYRHADDIGDWIEVMQATSEKVVNGNSGQLIATSYSAS